MRTAAHLVFLFSVLALAACVPTAPDDSESTGELGTVPSTIVVDGTTYNVENDYLPHVVQCENGAAPAQSLRAQAIAARTWLTYNLRSLHRTSVRDSERDQVMSCGKEPSAATIDAVKATTGQILNYNGPWYNPALDKRDAQGNITSRGISRNTNLTPAGSFVAGAKRSGDDCAVGADDGTEYLVTINVGKTGLDINVTRPPVASLTSPANRGAMGQNLANCLATKKGYTAQQLLKYFYGDDMEITGVASQDSPVSAPGANDPAGQTGADESSGDTSAGTGTSTDSGTPPSDVVAPDCTLSASASYPCFSHLLNCTVKVATCVLTASDKVWRQCGSDGSWSELTGDNAGPAGDCIASFDH